MSYLQDKKRKNKIATIIISIIVIFVIIFFHEGFARAGKAVIITISKPFLNLNLFIRDRFTSAIISRSSKRTLADKIIKLEEQLKIAHEQSVYYDAERLENEELRKIFELGFNKKNSVLAAIVLRSPIITHDTILIDKGGNDGIVKNKRVFVGDNIAIGQVSEVFPKTSIIKLYSFSDLKTEVFVLGSDLSLEITGRGGGNFEVTLPKDFILENGSPMVLPGSLNLLVGIIGEKISDDHDPFSKYLIRGAVNPNTIRFVSVQKNNE